MNDKIVIDIAFVSIFLSVGLLQLLTGTFSAHQDAGTIRGREKNEGGVNITWQRMPSRVLAYALYDTRSSLLPAMRTAVSVETSAAASAATPPGFTVH